ncbi:MAG: dTDP-4-dehydrorhamnose 3,5-epimerase family protein [Vicinamibacteria bacterium]|nr:dTDP-4-dehydrorhamnose 3,5-epimerase family protein [Vicinamibacteria bacterium]
MLPGAYKDPASVTKDWQLLRDSIDGVVVHEVLHVPRDHGVITEIFRPEWDPTGLPVVHVYQSRLFPGAIGAWSCHELTVDRLFVNQGLLKIVLFDGRASSPTSGRILELHAGDLRPSLVVVPPGVWHGLQNLGASDALVVNLPSRPYDYEQPDHYRLPYDSPEIPYRWQASDRARLRKDAR